MLDGVGKWGTSERKSGGSARFPTENLGSNNDPVRRSVYEHSVGDVQMYKNAQRVQKVCTMLRARLTDTG